MTSVLHTTGAQNNVTKELVDHYEYKFPVSQYPDKQILPSGIKFQFLRDNRNEDLFGIVTPKNQNHIFSLIPLVGKTMFYYRPPWLLQEQRSYRLLYNDIETESESQRLLFPNGNFIKSYTNTAVVACKNTTESESLDECYRITGNKTETLSETLSIYEMEANRKV